MLTKQKFKYLLALNLTWSIIGIFADWEWLSMIPSYLIPFTAICSLYPPLLTIWYLLKFQDKTPPNFLTLWIATGTLSYGIMAQIYFPLLMSWKGINFHDVGSMFWVAVYGFQTLIVSKYLNPVKIIDLFFVSAYLFAADFSHYQLKTFVDFSLAGYPLWMENATFYIAVSLQIAALIYYSLKSTKKSQIKSPSSSNISIKTTASVA